MRYLWKGIVYLYWRKSLENLLGESWLIFQMQLNFPTVNGAKFT